MATAKKTSKTAAAARKPAVRKPAAPKAGASKRSRPAVAAPRSRTAPARATAGAGGVAIDANKPKKPKLVRDSFTIPKGEFVVLQELKQRAGKAGAAVKKSELLRAGIKALAAMNDTALAAALAAVPAIKTGRPAKD